MLANLHKSIHFKRRGNFCEERMKLNFKDGAHTGADRLRRHASTHERDGMGRKDVGAR